MYSKPEIDQSWKTKIGFGTNTRDLHIECSKQFKWNLHFYVSGQSVGLDQTGHMSFLTRPDTRICRTGPAGPDWIRISTFKHFNYQVQVINSPGTQTCCQKSLDKINKKNKKSWKRNVKSKKRSQLKLLTHWLMDISIMFHSAQYAVMHSSM